MNTSSHERGHKGRRERDHDNDPFPICLGRRVWSRAEIDELGTIWDCE